MKKTMFVTFMQKLFICIMTGSLCMRPAEFSCPRGRTVRADNIFADPFISFLCSWSLHFPEVLSVPDRNGVTGAHCNAGRTEISPGNTHITFGHRIIAPCTHYSNIRTGQNAILGLAPPAKPFIKPYNSVFIFEYGLFPANFHAGRVFTVLTIKGNTEPVACPGHNDPGEPVYEFAYSLAGTATDAFAVINVKCFHNNC